MAHSFASEAKGNASEWSLLAHEIGLLEATLQVKSVDTFSLIVID